MVDFTSFSVCPKSNTNLICEKSADAIFTIYPMEKDGLTFVWVRAEVIKKNLKDDYDWIETYVDVPYSSEYFNSLKTEQKKAICQVRLLDKGIITNYDSISVGEKSDLNDFVDSNYIHVKETEKKGCKVTPNSSHEDIVVELAKIGKYTEAINALKSYNIENSDAALSIYKMWFDKSFEDLQSDDKKLKSKAEQNITKCIQAVLSINRHDVKYVNTILDIMEKHFDGHLSARAKHICTEGEAEFNECKERIIDCFARNGLPTEETRAYIYNEDTKDTKSMNDIDDEKEDEFESGVDFGTDDEEDDGWFSNDDEKLKEEK